MVLIFRAEGKSKNIFWGRAAQHEEQKRCDAVRASWKSLGFAQPWTSTEPVPAIPEKDTEKDTEKDRVLLLTTPRFGLG
jgi:hypothetical protein